MKRLFNKRPGNSYEKTSLTEEQQLVKEIWRAHEEWVNARKRFDYVMEKDQIDYAIYAMEAAEKRYEMLLRLAKKANAIGDTESVD